MKTPLHAHLLPLIAALLLSALTGCAYGEVRQVIRAQFANDTNCATVKLQKRSTWYAEEDPNQYKVSGCGVVRTYTCKDHALDELVSYDEPACTWEEGDADAPKIHVQEPTAGGDDMMDEPMDAPMDAPTDEPMDEPSDEADESEPSADDADEAADEPEDKPKADKPKAKVKGKLSGGLKLGGSSD